MHNVALYKIGKNCKMHAMGKKDIFTPVDGTEGTHEHIGLYFRFNVCKE